MAINAVFFDLSMVDPDTGLRKQARAYTIDGITNDDGSLRQLSIGQVVMALCLQRASGLEAGIIALMNEMEDASEKLEHMTKIEEEILAGTVDLTSKTLTYDGDTYTYKDFLSNILEIENVPSSANVDSSDFISSLESKMDEMNSFSQQKMIELQSQTSKRDQSYDMISNVLKSLNTVLVGNANNL
ncbi:MAG: hypothetical protein IKO43_01260 [Kiritimatiellae bacterium]|nr:hypothetical protein [Kiritimatiellia bacterium]